MAQKSFEAGAALVVVSSILFVRLVEPFSTQNNVATSLFAWHVCVLESAA